MPDDIVVYQFSRSRVEVGDFSHFLSVYAFENLPTGRRLRDMINSMAMFVEGYDNDTRELHSIPEVRAFYSAFWQAWPYGLYFCNLDTDLLRNQALCCLPSLATVKVDKHTSVKVQLDPLELLQFVRTGLSGMNQICDRGGMFEDRIYARTKAVFDYFNLPFAAPAPGG
jgi:hypothetical protein